MPALLHRTGSEDGPAPILGMELVRRPKRAVTAGAMYLREDGDFDVPAFPGQARMREKKFEPSPSSSRQWEFIRLGMPLDAAAIEQRYQVPLGGAGHG